MKEDLVRMTCEFCGTSDTFNVRDPETKLLPIIKKWHGVMRGDQPPGNGADTHDWYDCVDCLIAGVKRKRDQENAAMADQMQKDAALAKADMELKKSPYMVKTQ